MPSKVTKFYSEQAKIGFVIVIITFVLCHSSLYITTVWFTLLVSDKPRPREAIASLKIKITNNKKEGRQSNRDSIL